MQFHGELYWQSHSNFYLTKSSGYSTGKREGNETRSNLFNQWQNGWVKADLLHDLTNGHRARGGVTKENAEWDSDTR